jgi:uncharacterized protein YndB with AHSA1/START domain
MPSTERVQPRKKSMLKTIVIVVLLLIAVPLAVILALAATKPDTFRVERATAIKAPPEKIFPLLNDFHAWEAWSPYEKKDPNMKRTLSGAAAGKGAVYEWDGDGNVGAGRMEITESSPSSKLALNLDMTKPLTTHNVVEFTLEPEGDATTVTWAMKGEAPYFAKIIHVFFDMDSMVGTDFEAGLANLKAIAEK